MNKPIVIIPTYNNPLTIKNVADDVLGHGYELIIVDDGSITPVKEILTEEKYRDITILRHDTNQGKGAAIITGAKKAKELHYDSFVSMDGDGQHLASEISKLIEKNTLRDQIVIGCRNFNIDNIPKKSKIGRSFHNFWIKLNTGFAIQDSLTGFRLYPISITELGLEKKGFNFEIEVLVKHYWKHKKITESIIECYYPTPEERVSHFDNYNDTIMFVLLHLKFFFKKIINNY